MNSIVIVGPLTELSGNLHTISRIVKACEGLVRLPSSNNIDSLTALSTAAGNSSWAPLNVFDSSHANVCPFQLHGPSSASRPIEPCHDVNDSHLSGGNTKTTVLLPPPVALCVLLHAYRAGKAVFLDWFPHAEDPSSSNETLLRAVGRIGVRAGTPTAGKEICVGMWGTDINEFGKDVVRRQMERVARRMDAIVCFSSFAEDVQRLWSDLDQDMTMEHHYLLMVRSYHRMQSNSKEERTAKTNSEDYPSRWRSSLPSCFSEGRLEPPLPSLQRYFKMLQVVSLVWTAPATSCAVVRWTSCCENPCLPWKRPGAAWPPGVVLLLIGRCWRKPVPLQCRTALTEPTTGDSGGGTVSTCYWHDGVRSGLSPHVCGDPRVCAMLNTSVSEGQSQHCCLVWPECR